MKPQNLKISSNTLEKLFYKHRVSANEVWECFLNRSKGLLEDTRLEHLTEAPTLWFIAETNKKRLLKVVFMELDNEFYEIKTTYEPNQNEVNIYEKYA
jgi:hypothetical protein